MKNDYLHLPHFNDIYGQHSFTVPKKSIRFGGNKKYALESESIRWWNAVSIVSSAEYLDTSILGLFCCVAANFPDLCMDNDYFVSYFEREDNDKENCRGSAGAGWSSYGVDLM